jgi:pilus assembly protein CpaF
VPSAQSIVEGEVRELVRRRQLDPVLEPEETRRLVDEVLSDYLDRAAMSALPPLGDADAAARTVFDQVAGFGPLQQYFDDRTVEKICTPCQGTNSASQARGAVLEALSTCRKFGLALIC